MADGRCHPQADLIVVHCRGDNGDLTRLGWNRLSAAMIVLVVPESALDLEWTLRDLGADAVLEDTCGGKRLADVCRRGLQTAGP
jgi:hypothetical protein